MGTPKPRVVVGMPIYNASQWLSATMESWLRQSWSDFRLIISDNASDDSSFSMCREFARLDRRIVVHRNPRNVGVNGNFRRVLELGRDSDYFIWAASHDFFSPTYLERCVTVLERRSDAVLCCGRAKLFTGDVSNATDYPAVASLEDDGPLVRFGSVVTSLRRNNLVHGVARTDALTRTRGPDDHFSADNVLVAHLALMGKIIQLRDVIYYRRIDSPACTERMSDTDKARHLDPENRGMSHFTRWKIERGLARAMLQTSLPWRARLSGLLLVARCMLWDRRNLALDIAEWLRWRVGTIRGTRA